MNVRDFIVELQAAALADADMLLGAKIGLFTNSPVIGIDTVIGGLVEPTFTTYAQTVVVHVAGNGGDGKPILVAPPTEFFPTNAVGLPQVLNGAFIVNAAGDLLRAGYFAAPLILTKSLQHFHVVSKVDLNSPAASTFEGNFS